MKYAYAVLFLLASNLSWGHTMSPAFEVEWSLTETHKKVYVLTNKYETPAVYVVKVLNPDGTPAKYWETKREEYRLMPDSSTEVHIKFLAKGKRKLLVCSILKELGTNHEQAAVITRVCSRLIINGIISK